MKTNRWDSFGKSIFTIMTEAATKNGAINLAQGFPDFDGPKNIKDAAIAAINEGRNQYSPSYGIASLRQAIASYRQRRYGSKYDPNEEVTVFAGATEAIFCTILALCEPGDEVVTFEPFYDSYPAATLASGAAFKAIGLRAPDWTFDLEELKQTITPKTKILLLNTPHNPSGKVFSGEELGKICQLVIENDVILVSDEVYEELVFAPNKHIAPATIDQMRNRSVCISSTGKTFSMTGWKIGYALAPPEITRYLRTVHQFAIFCAPTPLQFGITAAFDLPNSYFEQFRAEFLLRRDLLASVLNKAGFSCPKPQGTYFALADYSNLSDKEDTDFALWLTKTAKVASIPVSVFCHDQARARANMKYLRFSFCKESSTLKRAGDNLARLKRNGSNEC